MAAEHAARDQTAGGWRHTLRRFKQAGFTRPWAAWEARDEAYLPAPAYAGASADDLDGALGRDADAASK